MTFSFYDLFLGRMRSTLVYPWNEPNYKLCPLCGQPWIALSRHLRKHHELSFVEIRRILEVRT